MYSNFGEAAGVAYNSSHLILSDQNAKLLFYTKDTNFYSNKIKTVNLKNKDDPVNIYRDYREFSVVDDIVELLLLQRESWKRVSNPFKGPFINLSWVGSDTSMVPKKFTSLEVDNEYKDFIMKDIFESNKTEIIELYESKMKELRDIKPSKEIIDKYSRSAIVNRLILSRSQVGTRLTKLTRFAGDKTTLYNMIRSYGSIEGKGKISDKIIPPSYEIDLTDKDIDIYEFMNNIFSNDENEIWVVKPVYGSHGMGMKITTQENIRINFSKWTTEKHFFNNKEVIFTKWMFSKFIKSFLWKLKNDNPASRRICDIKKEKSPFPQYVKLGSWDKVRVPKLMGDLHDPGDIDYNYTIVDEETGKKFNTFKVTNPSYRANKDGIETKGSKDFEKFRNLKFNDTLGRINKARIWVACNIQDGKYELCVYKKLLFELASMEFNSKKNEHYNDIQRVWTDANSYIYGKKEDVDEEFKNRQIFTEYNLDPINAARACDLDFCYIVDWGNGTWHQNGKLQQFPKDWDKIKQNLTNMLKVFFNASKDSVNCLSSPNGDVDTKGCFQYFGIDFIVDDDCNTWLLEFNTRPWSGYGFWWRNFFDPHNHHMPHKYIFIESILRRFVDPKFHKKAIKLPLSDCNDIDNLWETVHSTDFISTEFDSNIAIMASTIPMRDQANWVMNRQLKKVFKDRGWGVFPFGHLVKNPGLVIQGMTPYLNWLIKTYDRNTFQEKIEKNYPYMVASNIVNRIFPLVVYLGNKANLVDILRNKFPKKTEYDMSWDQLVPFTLNFKRNSKTLKNDLDKHLGQYKGSIKWIAKPSMGKQGTGIFISHNIDEIYKHIIHDPDENDTWSISRYIETPFVIQKRKTHIRTFILVSKSGPKIGVYEMKPHLLFMAGLPYNMGDAQEFMNSFIKENIKGKIISKDKKTLEKFNDFRNLTNLSKGVWMLKNWVKNPGDINKKKYEEKSIECRLLNEKNDKKNIGYEILSGDAQKLVDEDKGKDYYQNHISPQINKIVEQTIRSISDEIECVNKKSNKCYQYVAFDFMIEETNETPKVWMLEVNVNPGLRAPTKLLKGKGGMKNFMHSIFDYVLDDELDQIEEYETEKWDRDGKHKVWGGSEWIEKNHKKGDDKKYRYSTDIGGNTFDHNGNLNKYKSKVKFTQGDIIYKKKSTYIIPKGMSYSEKDKSKLKEKKDNLFTEIFTLSNSANEKSEDLVRNSYIIDKMDNEGWLQGLIKRLGGGSSQIQDFQKKQLGLSFGDSIVRHYFMRSEIDRLNKYLGSINSPSIGTLGRYLRELQSWQFKDKLLDKMKDKDGNPYILMYPFGIDPKITTSKSRGNTSTGMRQFLINNKMLPEAALIMGLGLTDLGSKLFRSGGFPQIPSHLLKKIKGKNKDEHPMCSYYTVEDMKNIFRQYGVKGISNLKRAELCDQLVAYVSMGLIDLEFPFANETFLGSGYRGFMERGVNPMYDFYIKIFESTPPVLRSEVGEMILAQVPQREQETHEGKTTEQQQATHEGNTTAPAPQVNQTPLNMGFGRYYW